MTYEDDSRLPELGIGLTNIVGRASRGSADLERADLEAADLRRADLRGANLRGADLSYALGDHLQFAFLAGVKCQDTVCFAIVLVFEHDRIGPIGPELSGHAGIISAQERGDVRFQKDAFSQIW